MMELGRRGFFSIDAVFAATLLLIVSAALVNTYQGRIQAAEWVGAGEEAKMACEKLAAAINTVYANGPDFELHLNLPPQIKGNDYSISFDSAQRVITAEVPGAGITGSIAKATVVCKNVVLRDLDLSRTIRVHWLNGNVEVVNV